MKKRPKDFSNLEARRKELNKTANPDNLLDEEVIRLSQELDKEIVKLYRKEHFQVSKREGEGSKMSGISIKNNRIRFYGNTAGYIENGKAVVDPMFQCEELKDYLTEKRGLDIEWTNGVFDRLASGRLAPQDDAPVLKSCRIHQLKPDVEVTMKFVGYDEMLERFGKPNPENYRVVYDGEIETNDLDAIYEKFNHHHPPGYQGHSLSISDVIELYDQSGSSFHYVDRFGFQEISFEPPQQEQGQTLTL